MLEMINVPCGEYQGKSAEDVVVQTANKLAEEGWEFVAVCPNQDAQNAKRWQLIAFFKKESAMTRKK